MQLQYHLETRVISNIMVHCSLLPTSLLLVNVSLSYFTLPPTALSSGWSLWFPLTFFSPLVSFLINWIEFSILYLPRAPQMFINPYTHSSWTLSLCPWLLLVPCPSQPLPCTSKVGVSALCSPLCSRMLLEDYSWAVFPKSTSLPWTPNEVFQFPTGPLHSEDYSKATSKHTRHQTY